MDSIVTNGNILQNCENQRQEFDRTHLVSRSVKMVWPKPFEKRLNIDLNPIWAASQGIKQEIKEA
jgi:hypothetical protein